MVWSYWLTQRALSFYFRLSSNQQKERNTVELIQWGKDFYHHEIEITQLPMSVTDLGAKSRKNFLLEDLAGQTVSEVVNCLFNNILPVNMAKGFLK